MLTVEEKLAWLDAISRRVQEFEERGGNLKSIEAVPLGLALLHAFTELARELGRDPHGWDAWVVNRLSLDPASIFLRN